MLGYPDYAAAPAFAVICASSAITPVTPASLSTGTSSATEPSSAAFPSAATGSSTSTEPFVAIVPCSAASYT